MLRSSNPVFTSNTFQSAVAQPARWSQLEALDKAPARATTMTVRGTAIKTLYLIVVTIVAAALSWNYFQTTPSAILPTMIGSAVLGLISGLLMLKLARWAAWFVPAFAVCEGFFVAAISVYVVNWKLGGVPGAITIVGQAAGITFAIAAATMLGYATGVLRLGGMARKMVIVATSGVMLYYLASFAVNLIFSREVIPQLGWSDSPIGIAFSGVVIVLAALNLVMDYGYIEDGQRAGAPKHMEWIAAFGLLTTLVWLYIEVLRLLAKLRR
jgi:uncharacterized YccA/Bax inhibitor family protein